ncbi:MAG: PaREP1 family protein [Thermoproteus sp.]
MVVATHPWRDLEGYIDARATEALYEFELAERFLEQGVYRNAAGKAFQGWKALLAALAGLNRELLVGEFKGVARLRERLVVERADFVIAVMPTSAMKKVANILAQKYGDDVVYLTELALSLHEFQYNGIDPTGALSRYTDLKDVEADLKRLVGRGREVACSVFKKCARDIA